MRNFCKSSLLGLILAVWCAWAVLAPSAARAGTLTIQTSVSAVYRDDRVQVSVTIKNLGDESAFKLSAKATLGEASTEAPGPEELPPNKPVSLELSLPFKPALPGTYAVVIWVRFHDSNGYPFSSMGNSLFPVGKAPAASLMLRGLPTTLEGESEVVFDLANLDEREKNVELAVYGPQELNLPKGVKNIRMAGRSKEPVPVLVSNFTALPGATYPVLCLATYREGGTAYTVLSSAPVTVAAEKDPLKQLMPYLLPAAVVLVIAIALLLWLKRGGANSGPAGKSGA